ncbi:MAG: hypothetical protein R3B72_49845 [Polyangiaceae bacterium]
MIFKSLVAGKSDEATLGRDGVTCSLCHQIADSGLGTTASYTGGFDVGYSRKIFGPHLGPDTEPMQFFVSYEPTYAEHTERPLRDLPHRHRPPSRRRRGPHWRRGRRAGPLPRVAQQRLQRRRQQGRFLQRLPPPHRRRGRAGHHHAHRACRGGAR